MLVMGELSGIILRHVVYSNNSSPAEIRAEALDHAPTLRG